MALLHVAELRASKADAVAMFPGLDGAEGLELVGASRLDDPAGVVGIETHLARTAEAGPRRSR